ncbi:PilZ domain-containing protein [Neptunicella marina]|uniref:Cyclic diguanosine monophosphate-binding protein n=1 Tax=Neptunicella marina TaxID=2125989 RepID=A0A8J6IQD7_9ALTE|nr:PilZ domain-containing protein [Neptunicella marina]
MDKRRFTRIVFSAPVQLRQGTHEWQSQLIDLSLHGVLVARPDDFEPDMQQDLLVTFQLEGLSNSILIVGKISHINQDAIGIGAEMIDLDSISQLRRLVELNMGDDALLHRNFRNLCELEN